MPTQILDPLNRSESIAEIDDEGCALRKDGTKLSPASRNPWYVLATIAGKEENSLIFNTTSPEIRRANRRLWNAWSCQPLTETERSQLAKKMNFDAEDLAPITDDERDQIIAKFREVFPEEASPEKELIPNPLECVDFSNTLFLEPLNISGFICLGGMTFNSSIFNTHVACDEFLCLRNVSFSKTAFQGPLSCRRSNFHKKAIFSESDFCDVYFDGSIFTDYAHFDECSFLYHSNFKEVHFCDGVSFERADFKDNVDFSFSNFTKIAWFGGAVFRGYVSYMSTSFSGPTVFRETNFKRFVPVFSQCEVHHDTRFSESTSLWPNPEPTDAQEDKLAYMRLRQIAAGNNNPDLEHFFLRQEMRCKEVLSTGLDRLTFASYRLLSDNGISITRPTIALLTMWLVPSFIYLATYSSEIMQGIIAMSPLAPFGLSFANLFSFLGLNRLYFGEVIEGFGPWLTFLAGAQTVSGVVLLFFLGLGLRNRFRLK